MRAAWSLVILFAVAAPPAISGKAPAAPSGTPSQGAGAPDIELELGKIYAGLGDWTEAEAHFLAAAKDDRSPAEALAGLENARRRADAAETAFLSVGQQYEDAEMWSKAEELYRSAAADRSLGEQARRKATERLAMTLYQQRWDRRWSEAKDWLDRTTTVAAYLVIALALGLIGMTVWAIAGRRRMILIHPFAAPTDDSAKSLAILLRYARDTMRDPALSPAGQLPPPLVTTMLFDDEAEPIEDVELAGSKIPFAALARWLGKPSVQVEGSFDAVAPLGNAFCSIETRGAKSRGIVQHSIRVGTADQQRQDLRDFAYDVVRKAVAAHAIL